MVDTGNGLLKGPGPIPLDGEDGDLEIDAFRFITGGARWGRSCHNTDDTSLACDRKGPVGAETRWSGEDVWISGAEGRIHRNYDNSEDESVCLDNAITTSVTTTTGTCRGDRRYLCWDADGDGNTGESRADGSCRWTGVSTAVDLGPCEGFVDALATDLAAQQELRLAFRLSQCTQPARSPEHCAAAHGHTGLSCRARHSLGRLLRHDREDGRARRRQHATGCDPRLRRWGIRCERRLRDTRVALLPEDGGF